MANRNPHSRFLLSGLFVFLLAIFVAWSGQLGCKSKTSEPPKKKPATQQIAKPADGSPPKLTLDEEFIDAGVLEHGATCDKIVSIRNTGGRELVIRKAMKSCKCVQASFDQMKIQPGQSTRMAVKILTLDHQGEVYEKLGIISNDPAGPKVLAVRFEVRRDLVAVPRRLYMGLAKPRQTMRQRVKIVANADVDTKALYAISSNQALIGRVVEPVLKKNTPAILEVVFKASSKPGTYRNSLLITTGHSAQPTVCLPVMLCVSQTVSVLPDRLDFGHFTRGENVKRSLKVETGAGTKLKVMAAHPKVLDVKVGPVDSAGTVTIDLTVRKEVRYGQLAGEIHLEFDGEEQGTLTVPFAGYVAGKSAP